jgi:hypothetical protein
MIELFLRILLLICGVWLGFDVLYPWVEPNQSIIYRQLV